MGDTMAKVNAFRKERNWRHFHKEKDLAISISLEAAELLELFQWRDSEDTVSRKKTALQEELADVLIYSYMLADNLGLDIDEIITAKLVKNAQRYPADKVLADPAAYEALKQQDRKKRL